MSPRLSDPPPDPTRRAALQGVAAAAAAFVFGFRVPTAIAGQEA
jgi:hypothetical protein